MGATGTHSRRGGGAGGTLGVHNQPANFIPLLCPPPPSSLQPPLAIPCSMIRTNHEKPRRRIGDRTDCLRAQVARCCAKSSVPEGWRRCRKDACLEVWGSTVNPSPTEGTIHTPLSPLTSPSHTPSGGTSTLAHTRTFPIPLLRQPPLRAPSCIPSPLLPTSHARDPTSNRLARTSLADHPKP